MHGIPVWAEGPSLTLYISAVSEDIRPILSETIVHQALSPTNRKQPAHGHISISGFIANMPCRVSLALAYSLRLPSTEPKRLEIDPVMYRKSNRKSGSENRLNIFPPYFYFRFGRYRPLEAVFGLRWLRIAQLVSSK